MLTRVLKCTDCILGRCRLPVSEAPIHQRHYPSAHPLHTGIGVDAKGKVPRITFLEARHVLREEVGFGTSSNTQLSAEEEKALGEHSRSSPRLVQTDVFTIDQYLTQHLCASSNQRQIPITPASPILGIPSCAGARAASARKLATLPYCLQNWDAATWRLWPGHKQTPAELS
ncbi:hypothetical protein QBC34DRAFT_411660 [Podospora aff. communis PSN243]|uniref:Uncharacterized protein n=1 Tax=Podospora aff. communis PSN243 TaxID=3040156 RepID=A0AAV9GD94_9PEZI|nr:hypothetical protein QBC34DRAFT_411660 [Podospora aff. communis PSN243]